jgi:hypothetical protein
MIYPDKKKIRKFEGGGSASLFDNPGTYLGIQYIPKTQVLPDVEGLQYLMQMDQAKIEAQQKAAAAAKAVKNDSHKNFADLYKEFSALTKQGRTVIDNIDGMVQGWYERYPTVEAMNSSEANAEMVRILNTASKETLRAKNDKATYDKRYNDAESVMSNYYYNNGNLAIQDVNDPSKIKHVSDDDYFSKKESEYKDYRPMKISDIFGWMNDYSDNPLQSGLDVNQISYEKRQENIDKFFKSFATDSSSVSGGNLLKEELKKVGIENVADIDVADFKIKMQSGEMNAGVLLEIFSKNMDPKVYNSIRSEMIEKGQNPNQVVGTTKDAEGKEHEVTAFQNKVFELFTGEKIKKLGTVSELSVTTADEAKVAAKRKAEELGEGDGSSKLNVLKNRADDVVQFAINNKLTMPQPSNVYNPFTGKSELSLALTITDMDDGEISAIIGHEPDYREIHGGVKKVIAGGREVTLAKDNNSKHANEGPRYFESPLVTGVRVYDVPDPNTKNNELVGQTTLDTHIYVNESALSTFIHPSKKDKDGNPARVTYQNFGESGYIERVTRAEFEAEALAFSKEKSASGVAIEDRNWFINMLPGKNTDDYIYRVRVEVPLSNLTGANGIAPSKATSNYLSEQTEYGRILRVDADRRKAELAKEKVEKATAELEKNGK